MIVNLVLLDESCASECIADIKHSIQTTKMQITEQLPKHKEIFILVQTILKQQLMFLETLEK